MRKNIFEIINDSKTITLDSERIETIAEYEKIVHTSQFNYSLFDFVNVYCFKNWKHRGHCVNFGDFLKSIDYNQVKSRAMAGDCECFLLFAEIILNVWYMAKNRSGVHGDENYYLLHDIILDDLKKYNYTAVFDDYKVLVIEDNPAVTAVAETLDHEDAIEIIQYNHHTMKGDIGSKKKILNRFGQKLEACREDLQTINPDLKETIFYILNNFDIRHNNKDSNGKNYNPTVANMSQNELETVYDDLYQMILLAFLELDNKERISVYKELRRK